MKLYTNNELLSLFERHIAQMPTPEEPQRLYAPIKYGLEEGGKRIRPILLMLTYNVYAEDYQNSQKIQDQGKIVGYTLKECQMRVWHSFWRL